MLLGTQAAYEAIASRFAKLAKFEAGLDTLLTKLADEDVRFDEPAIDVQLYGCSPHTVV